MEDIDCHYVCFIYDNAEEMSVSVIVHESDFIKLISYLDKERFEIQEINVVNVPVYNDISFFIKKKPDDLITGA